MLVHLSVHGGHLDKPLVDKPEQFRISMNVEGEPRNLGDASVCSDERKEPGVSVCHRCMKRLPELLLSLVAVLFILSADCFDFLDVCSLFLNRRPLDLLRDKDRVRQ